MENKERSKSTDPDSNVSILPISPEISIGENNGFLLDRKKQLSEELERLKKEEYRDRLSGFDIELKQLMQKYGVKLSPKITIIGTEITSTLYLEIIESSKT